jgi:hypothetical protein
MTDEQTPGSGATDGAGAQHDAPWEEPTAQPGKSNEWLAQLQTMIEQLATQAAPVVREVGAKAAELAAKAGEKAGPVAHRAAEMTSEAGLKLAERSRTFAAGIRRDQAARGEGPTAEASSDDAAAETSDEPTPTGVG